MQIIADNDNDQVADKHQGYNVATVVDDSPAALRLGLVGVVIS